MKPFTIMSVAVLSFIAFGISSAFSFGGRSSSMAFTFPYGRALLQLCFSQGLRACSGANRTQESKTTYLLSLGRKDVLDRGSSYLQPGDECRENPRTADQSLKRNPANACKRFK
ncbi:MAG TPA: hypothetical protein VF343_02675 [Syntrophales bacterium]